MLNWLRSLDALLRGEHTRAAALSGGRFELPLRVFIPLAIILGALYGWFMAWYSVASVEEPRWNQMLYAMIKVPALFLLTLFVTFPSLYVFNALVGTRLSFLSTLRLLIAAIVITLAIAASLGPIVAFFTLSTTSYPFMVMLNVVMLGLSGVIGLGFLLNTLRKMARTAALDRERRDAAELQARGDEAAPATTEAEQVSSANLIFQVWVIIFGLVGAQMSWLLRPFIGHPGGPITFFRPREGNFFQSVLEHISQLLGT
jgi:hypothetical protein